MDNESFPISRNQYAKALLIAKSSVVNKIKVIASSYNLPVGLMGEIDSEIDEIESKIKLLEG